MDKVNWKKVGKWVLIALGIFALIWLALWYDETYLDKNNVVVLSAEEQKSELARLFALNIDELTGEDGQDGAVGVGIDGAAGARGLAGLNGKDGKDGVDGEDGIDGINGTNGVDGKDGVNGIDGQDGINGVDGEDGVDGVDGKDGTNGFCDLTKCYKQLNLGAGKFKLYEVTCPIED